MENNYSSYDTPTQSEISTRRFTWIKQEEEEAILMGILKKLCTEYGVYLRSDDDEGLYCHEDNHRADIADAAMRVYFKGYDELIELLENE